MINFSYLSAAQFQINYCPNKEILSNVHTFGIFFSFFIHFSLSSSEYSCLIIFSPEHDFSKYLLQIFQSRRRFLSVLILYFVFFFIIIIICIYVFIFIFQLSFSIFKISSWVSQNLSLTDEFDCFQDYPSLEFTKFLSFSVIFGGNL